MNESTQPPAPPRSRLREPEMIVALSAVVIGLCALLISLMQVRMMHEQQHASVWPRLTILPSYSERGLSVEISNPGLGPAIVRSVEVAVGGKTQRTWRDVLSSVAPNAKNYGFTVSTINHRILPPAEKIVALTVPDPVVGEQAIRRWDQLRMEICYCSLYERCWVAASDQPDVREVNACAAREARAFRQ